MKKAGAIFFIVFVMALVLTVSLIIGGILWMDGMLFFFPLLAVGYIAIGIFVVRAVIDWEKQRKLFNRLMAVAVVLSIIYAIPGVYERTHSATPEESPATSEVVIIQHSQE